MKQEQDNPARKPNAEPFVRARLYGENHMRVPVLAIALLASSSLGDAAAFREFLLSADGTAIFRRHGFGTR